MADGSATGGVTVASKVHFAELCGLLEKISKTQGNDKKKRILKDFIDQWRQSHKALHGDNKDTTDSFYPAMRLLLPHLEKERVAYGIKENTLAKLLIEVLCLGKDSPDALRLLHYKAPKTAKADAGDFASVAYFVLQNRCPTRGTLTIQEVNDCLNGIAENNAAKKKDLVRKHILRLLTNLSAVELKWLTRMIVKELKVGLSQASVLSVYHPDAEEFYNVNNNLEKVCRLMRDLSVRIHEIGVSVFSPFSPMLGERASPDKVEKLMDSKPYYIEVKYDGERMLLHKSDDEYKYFSRSGNEYTNIFGSNSFDGSLTPYIHNIFKPECKTCILDGEMLLYHPESKTFATKAMNTDVKKERQDGFQPCLHVFDILLYNDKVLTNLPLKERLGYLEKVFTPCEGRMIISQHKEARTNQDCADALNEAIDGREEGIMVKNPDSVYRPNTRKGGWFKIKPEYVGGLMDELDVLVVGGYFGVGSRAGMMSHFMCAVAIPPEEGTEPKLFYSFCKPPAKYPRKEQEGTSSETAQPTNTTKTTLKRKPNIKLKMVTAINRSFYYTAIRRMYNSKSGKKAILKFFKVQARKEAAVYGKANGSFSKKVTQSTLSNFSWSHTLNEIKEYFPTTYACLSGILTTKQNEENNMSVSGDSYGVAVPVLGFALGIMLYRRNPWKFDFLQELCSLEMWGSGSNQRLFQHFQRFGISKGKQGAVASVDRLTREFDKEITDWQLEIQEELKFKDESRHIEETPSDIYYDGHSPPRSAEPSPSVSEEEDTFEVTRKEGHSPPRSAEPSPSVSEEEDTFEVTRKEDVDYPPATYSPPMDLDEEFSTQAFRGDVAYPPATYSPPMDLDEEFSIQAFRSIPNQPVSNEDENLQLIEDILASQHLCPQSVPGSPSPSDSGDTIPALEHPGYSLVWDNVGILSTVRHQNTNNQNKYHLWALCFAVKNRVNFRHLPEDPKNTSAQDIPIHMFLPSQDEYDNLKMRMEVIVMRIIKEHIPVFSDCEAQQHIPHQYSQESALKSRIVNLGTIDANPSSTQGVITIMDTLHQYVPTHGDNILPIPIHGDGLSIERMRDAKAARAASLNAAGRFEGLEPVPQEFHRRVLLMQDMYNQLYSTKSGADRGTLFQIRNRFGHKNVTTNAMKSFNHNADLLRFSAEGLTTLLAMKICGIENQEETPADFPDTQNQQNDYLLYVAQKVVETVWEQVSVLDIQAVLDSHDDGEDGDDEYFEYCICKEDTEEDMIKCSNNMCRNGAWFHLTCVEINEEYQAGHDWWCSDECRESGRSQYCHCGMFRQGEELVHCAKGVKCKGFEVYHKGCLHLNKSPGVKWVCDLCKAKKTRCVKEEDHVFTYQCCLLFNGLKDLAYRDIVRENDGIGMVETWRIDMPQFWQNGHNKYMIIGHKFLSDVQGGPNTRLKSEIIWNRTANLSGGLGHNIPLDLVNEFLNRDFKDNMKRRHGKYTARNVARTSKFVGTLSRDVDRAFQRKLTGAWISRHSDTKQDLYKADVQTFIQEYANDRLFDVIPGRQHSAFPGFVSVRTIDHPGKCKARLKKYSKKLDIYRSILP